MTAADRRAAYGRWEAETFGSDPRCEAAKFHARSRFERTEASQLAKEEMDRWLDDRAAVRLIHVAGNTDDPTVRIPRETMDKLTEGGTRCRP